MRRASKADCETGGVYSKPRPNHALRHLHPVVLPAEFRVSSIPGGKVPRLHTRHRWIKILEQAEYCEEAGAGSDVGGSYQYLRIHRCYGGFQRKRQEYDHA